MIDLISAFTSWIAERSIIDWLLFGAYALAIANVGMVAASWFTGPRAPKGDDGLDFYRPGDLAQRYRDHEGW